MVIKAHNRSQGAWVISGKSKHEQAQIRQEMVTAGDHIDPKVQTEDRGSVDGQLHEDAQ